ncbi:zinc-binding dehydrogenase [Deinococcus sp. UYEF24]
MKAAVLKAFGTPLSVEQIPDPILGTGEVIVDVIAAQVLSYMNEVLSGERRYLLDLPQVPGSGAIGRVRVTGPDATHLKPGDWVMCDPAVRSRDDVLMPDITLQGLSARGEGGLKLQAYYRGGGFAEQMRVPTENAIAIGEITPADAGRWCAVNIALVPYGGLLAAQMQAGETVLVSGATGQFGSSAVAVALAMGAGRVIAPGRNQKILNDVQRRFGERVITLRLTGEEEADRGAMQQAAGRPIDVVLDILPPEAPATAARTAAMTVRQGGRVVLMGGVGMLGGVGLNLPYPWIMRNNVSIIGSWMYPPVAVVGLARLIHAGLLRLDDFEVTPFPLDQANEAVAYAAAHGGPFKMTVIQP